MSRPRTVDWAAVADELEQLARVRSAWQRAAARWLAELTADSPPRRILDVGSGPGVTTCLLARQFPEAEVLAVDVQPELLARAAALAGRLGLDARVRTRRLDLNDVTELPTADLIWASSVVHHFGDQVAMLARLASRISPGGLLAVAEGGLPSRFLPRDTGIGRPGLQARLDALMEDWFTERRHAAPGSVRRVDDWLALLAAAGLRPRRSRTFLVDLPSPLDDEARDHVRSMLARLRDLLADRIEADDRAQLERLLDPRADEGVLRRPDVFVLAATTVHIAHTPATPPRPRTPAARATP
ncbi:MULTISPECIES: class I SAM-dependent methyltransferase [Polymorphospora]|uniref:Class I SAM-dependent methyltransferase n=1 Tax=Polymorphospora lycopeni TaxID=3140240 RepID=A0ABV5CP41_9ACTN